MQNRSNKYEQNFNDLTNAFVFIQEIRMFKMNQEFFVKEIFLIISMDITTPHYNSKLVALETIHLHVKADTIHKRTYTQQQLW